MKKEKLILLIVIIGFLVYFNSLFNGFVWDDEEQIVNHYLVHSIKNLPAFFTGSTFNPGGASTLGGIFCIFCLAFHLHFFPLDMTVAERWFYLPLVGLLGMFGAVAPKLPRTLALSGTGAGVKIIIVITVIGLLAIRTFIRTFDWRKGLTLYSHDIKISKDAFDLENNLGKV